MSNKLDNYKRKHIFIVAFILILIIIIALVTKTNIITRFIMNNTSPITPNDISSTSTEIQSEGNASTEPATEITRKLFHINGKYVYAISEKKIAIHYNYQDTNSAYIYTYSWSCTAPADFTPNQYGEIAFAFYDEMHGFMLSFDDAAAGSAYYDVFYTDDGGQNWIKYDAYFQRTNTPAAYVCTDESSLVVLETGVGLCPPVLDRFEVTDNVIKCISARETIASIKDIPSTFTILNMSTDYKVSCEYTSSDSNKKAQCEIDLISH